MPATSEKQKKFMDAVAHDKGFAKKVGVPQSVGAEFSDKSKGMKFGSGSKTRADSQTANSPKTNHGGMALFKQGGNMASKMNPGFMAMMAKKKDAKPSAMGKATMKPGMSTAKDGMKKPTPMAGMMGMNKGGMPMKMKDGKKVPIFAAKGGMHKMPDGKMMKDSAMKKMANGGSASSRADGIAAKGKTKGKMLSTGGMSKKYC